MAWLQPRYERRRTKLLRAAPPGPLHDYLAQPLPGLHTPLTRLPLLAVDLETTGLDPGTDQILSIGFVPLDGLTIELGGAHHTLIRQSRGVGKSATIHGITDDALATGIALPNALTTLLNALQGRCLLAHYSRVEEEFLAAACRSVWGLEPTFIVVDTMVLQHRIITHVEDEAPPGSLRLAAARGQFNLPRYRAHDALTDALAAAELYLAQVDELGASTLADVKS